MFETSSDYAVHVGRWIPRSFSSEKRVWAGAISSYREVRHSYHSLISLTFTTIEITIKKNSIMYLEIDIDKGLEKGEVRPIKNPQDPAGECD